MSENNQYQVSVVIPYYNDSSVFERCIKSIAAQSVKPIEVIIIDDNSDDTSSLIKIIDHFRDELNILLHRNDINKNAAFSRNLGVNLASGQVIALLDADDYWEKNHLETSLNGLISTQSDFVYSNITKVNSVGEVSKIEVNDVSKLANPFDILFISPAQTGSFVFIKSNCIDVTFNESLRRHQDYQFFIDMIKKGKKIHYINDYTSYYCESTRPLSSRVNFDSMFLFWNENSYLFSKDKLKLFLMRNLCYALRIGGDKKITDYVDSYPVFNLLNDSFFMRLVNFLGVSNILSRSFLILFYYIVYDSKKLPILVFKRLRILTIKKFNL